MGYNSQSGKVIVGTQTAKGVTRTDLGTLGLGLKLTSGSLAGNRELITADPEIGGGRDLTDALGGPTSFSGEYGMYARNRAIAFFLKNVLGEAVSAPDGTEPAAHIHTITPVDGQIPFFSVYEEISDNLERFLYTDAMVNTFHMEAEAGGLLTATAGVIARQMVAGTPALSASALTDNTSMFVGTNINITYNGVAVPAKSFSIDINNNIEDDDFRLGSLFLGDMTAKSREITASMTLRHENSAAMRQALFGTTTATQIGGLLTKEELVILIESYENITGTGIKFSTELTFPKVIFNPFAFEPSGDDALENDVEMTVVRPDPAVKAMTAVVTNDVAAIA